MAVLRVRRLILSILVVVLFASGCGSESETTTASSSTTSSTTSAPDTTTTSTTTASTSTSTTTTEAPTQVVLVYFGEGDGTDCAQVGSHERSVPADADPIRAAFDALVEGPTTDEQDAGAHSFFSEQTAGLIRSTELVEGLLVVDMHDQRDLLNNATASCGSSAFLTELTETAFQFEEVEDVMLEMEGSCDLIMNWLQRDCTTFGRDGSFETVPLELRADGSGCAPGQGPLPDGRWFGYIDAASDTVASFDLACWFTGAAAVEAAAQDGWESPPPNDYHIRNEHEVWRDIEVASGAQVAWLPIGDPASATDISYTDWISDRFGRTIQPGLWLTIEGGVIVELAEQYQP